MNPINTPGTVVFTPDGSHLIVTTKANGDDVDVFGVLPGGQLSSSPVVNPLAETVPFAVVFDRQGHVILAESAGALATRASSPASESSPCRLRRSCGRRSLPGEDERHAL